MTAAAERSFDIAILGAGPAGAFAAALLARKGARVALLGAAPSRPRLEGISERAIQTLAAHGFGPPPGSLSPPLPRRAHWGGTAQGAHTERLVDRIALDRALGDLAQANGAIRFEGPIFSAGAGAASGEIRLADGRTVRTARIVEARGARAPRPAAALKGPPLLGIGQAFRRAPSVPGIDVVPLAEGWLWAASADGASVWVQAAVDPDALESSGEAGLTQLLGALLKAPGGAAVLGPPGDAAGPPLAREAGPVLCAEELDPLTPRIGDAAARFDPLSGHGLFFALSSALALPPILTALEEGDAGIARARAFYRQRVADTFWRQARVGRDFYRLEPCFAAAPFWSARARWPDEAPAHTGPATPAFRPGVAVEHGRLVDIELLATPEDPAGVAWVAGIPLVPLLRRLAGLGTVADWPRFRQCCGQRVAPEAARACFDWLAARGLLEPGAIKDCEGDGRR